MRLDPFKGHRIAQSLRAQGFQITRLIILEDRLRRRSGRRSYAQVVIQRTRNSHWEIFDVIPVGYRGDYGLCVVNKDPEQLHDVRVPEGTLGHLAGSVRR